MEDKKEEKENPSCGRCAIENSVKFSGISQTISECARKTAGTTNEYNRECTSNRNILRAKATANKNELDCKLAVDSKYVGDRNKAVNNAWEYEKADINMGGKGSGNWTPSQRKEISEIGKVRGAEGHHINSVAENPEMQTDPNNIKFYKSKTEHKDQGHKGNWSNPSYGELIDKDRMLKRTNTKRVLGNEVSAVAGVTLGSVVWGVIESSIQTCREEGVSCNSIMKGVKNSVPKVATYLCFSLITYAVNRGMNYCLKH